MGSREEVPPQDMSQDPAEPGSAGSEDWEEAPSRAGDDPLAQSALQRPPIYHLAYRLM